MGMKSLSGATNTSGKGKYHGMKQVIDGVAYYYNNDTGKFQTKYKFDKYNKDKKASDEAKAKELQKKAYNSKKENAENEIGKAKLNTTSNSNQTLAESLAADNSGKRTIQDNARDKLAKERAIAQIIAEDPEKQLLQEALESKTSNRIAEIAKDKQPTHNPNNLGIGFTAEDGVTLAEQLMESGTGEFADEKNIMNNFVDDSAMSEIGGEGGADNDGETNGGGNSFDQFTAQYLDMINAEANRVENRALQQMGQNSLQNRRDIQKRRMAAIKSGASSTQLAMEEMANVMAGQRGATALAQQLQDNRMGLINDFYGNTQNLMSVNYTADQARAGQNDMAMSAFLNNKAVANELGIGLEDVLDENW